MKSRDPHFLLDDSCIQKYTQNVLPEVISDPLNDFDNDSYEEGDEMQRQVRSHQVYLHLHSPYLNGCFYRKIIISCILAIFHEVKL